jgi:predicted amidohydrolase
MHLEENLKIGLIQTTIDHELAWSDDKSLPVHILPPTEEYVWAEIRKGFIFLKNHSSKPHIILLPELTIPLGRVNDLRKLCAKINAVIIAGLDFEIVNSISVLNRAVIIVPNNWPQEKSSKLTSVKFVGKTNFSYVEKEYFKKKGLKESSDYNIYQLDAAEFGRIGIAICSDFFDLERFQVYRGNIHHLIVLSYNKDIPSFYALAEALSRIVYCNVIVCNTGYYGGSLVFSPFKEQHKRILYKHEGKGLFTTQIVEIPVKDLDDAQQPDKLKDDMFKAQPPGYKQNRYKRTISTIRLSQ